MRYAASFMPTKAPLPMAAQAFNEAPEHAREGEKSLSDFALRFVAFAPALGIAILLSFAIFQWFAAGGVTLLERAIVALVGLTFVWISFSVITVLMALVQRMTRPCRLARTGRGPSERVALLIPVYHEDPASVFGNANAMLQELARGAQHDNYALFILSDTRDPELAEMEERAFFSLRQNCALGMDVFYRRRLVNADKKVGNLTDWIEGWGGAYDAMLVLDADSLMSGGAIRRLTHELSADLEAGLIQSVPVLIGAQTLFGRMQQFSNAVYGWLLSEGVALWAQGEGNYWGHNAIIRTRAFAQSARLPYLRSLRGKDSLILSHDFVEAGMLRRAGWRVKFLPRLGGSYEETPQTLIDYALRDRRWCLGNLQHLRLLGARGFHPMSRFHMLQGAAAFLLSPLWFALVLIWSVLGMMPEMITQTYFVPSNPLYPIWSGADQAQGWIYMAVIYTMLLLPKLIGALALCARGDIRRDYGGAGRFIATMLFEVICAIIYAPIMMVQQTLAVFSAVSGRAATWSPQARGVEGYDLSTTLRFHKVETLLGLSLSFGIASGTVPLSLLPVALPLLLAVALSMLGSVSIAKAKLSWMRLESPQALRVPRIVKRANEERAKMQRALETPEPIAIAAE